MQTNKRKKVSLKAFLLKKSTLIGWTIILLLSVPLFTLIFNWSIIQAIFFITVKGLFAGTAVDAKSTVLHYISLFYFMTNLLVYTFNLYPLIRKIILDAYND